MNIFTVNEFTITVFSLVALLFSVVIHELAHGSVAYSLGDSTAKFEGRLTLNPLKHIDMFGSIFLPLLLILSYMGTGVYGPVFGWAKPVPINPYNFRDQKWGPLKVAFVGPATNFLIAVIFGMLIRISGLPLNTPIIQFFSIVVSINFLLAIFNLVPIPPLDGSWILLEILPERFYAFKAFLRQYGMYILLLFIFLGGLQGLDTVIDFLFRFVIGI